MWVESNTEAGCPEKLWVLHPWRYSKPDWTWSSTAWGSRHCSEQGLGWMTSRASATLSLLHNASFRRTCITLGISSSLLLFSPAIQCNRRALEAENGKTVWLIISYFSCEYWRHKGIFFPAISVLPRCVYLQPLQQILVGGWGLQVLPQQALACCQLGGC